MSRRQSAGPRRKGQLDAGLLSLTMILLIFGLGMLCSASWILANQQFGDPWHYVKRQLIWTGAGLALMSMFSRLPYKDLRRWVWPALILTWLCLAAVLFTRPVAGVKRWLHAGPLGIQPAEFAKLVIVVYLADYLDRRRSKLSTFKGVAIPLLIMGTVLALVLAEPDLGTPALLFSVGVCMLFVGGGSLAYLGGALAVALPVLAYQILRYSYRRRRLLNFMDPFQDAQGTGYQLSQSLLAVGSGGWLGNGLGSSKLKLGFLPAPHTDFIFPILCEELGLLGSLTLILLFVAFLVRGVRIARAAPNLFGTLLAAGISFLICLQAFFNVAMSIGLVPTKGLPLPFFSSGGSSMLVTLSAVGILLNISRHSNPASERQAS